jgi:hypothetical protein
MKSRFCAVAAFLVSAGMCTADAITITLMPGTLTGSPGSVINFGGTLENTTGSTVFLNSAGINLAGGFSPADLDTSPFFANAPFFLLANEVTVAIDLFTIHIPHPFAGGSYPGTFTVLGGLDDAAQDIIGSANFTIEVNSVPEPNSGAMVGLIALVFLLARMAFGKSFARLPGI